MELDQFIRNMGIAIKELESLAPLQVEENALNAKALVQDRIQSQGLQGAEYSTNDIPVFLLYKSATNSAGREFLKGKKKANYGELKEAQFGSRPGVDLTLTGRMWAGIQVTERAKSGNLYIAVLGGSDQEVQSKLKQNIERFGEFLLPNSSEQTEITQATEQKFLTVMKKYL